jgi:predicted chitinase
VIPPDHPDVPGDDACGADVTPLGSGRCGTSKETALGTALTVHNFEDPGEANDHLAAFFADKRAGEWWEAHYPDNGGTATMAVEATTGATPSSKFALHYSGTAPGGWGATAGLTIADCYDASAHSGIGFSIKGNPAAGNAWVKFSVHSPVSEPEPAGGCSTADETAMKCRDHFAVKVPVTSSWVRHNLTWGDLGQQCASNIDSGYNPGAEIISMSFSVTDIDAGFDFWIDDLGFDVGTEPASGFAAIVSKATFEELWRTEDAEGVVTDLRNPFYTYEGLVAATASYPGFGTSGDWTSNRREVAAFLANIAHESDSLGLVEETNCKDAGCDYGEYYGRGPIQLTWVGNYTAAGSALGHDLVGNPDLVSTDPAIAFATALWFWNTSTGAGSATPHNAIQSGSFSGTIRAINGALECGGGPSAAGVQNRIDHYLRFCQYLGVDPGTDLTC